MEVQRMRQLMLLWSRMQSTRVALVGGNHTASRILKTQIQLENEFQGPEEKEQGVKIMELVHEFRDKKKNQSRIKRMHYRGRGIEVIPDNHVIIKLPDSRVLRVVARSVFLALVIITFHKFGFIREGSSNSDRAVLQANIGSDPINGDLSVILFRDLINEGLVKSEAKALFLSHGVPQLSYGNDMYVSESDLERQNSVPHETFDFAFASGFGTGAAQFIDRTLKIGGIAAVEISHDPLNAFHKPPNYKIVYLRQFESTVVVMRKTGPGKSKQLRKTNGRRLCEFPSEAKRAALKGLEDVLLEPPRTASMDSNEYLKRTKYLPELMGDSLEQYPRRVFIDVASPEDDSGGNAGWFERNYPTRNRDFEMYEIETVTAELPGKEVVGKIGMSEWLRKNVKEEDYVVIKAEADVVEEMVKRKAICLVDELFLECKYQYQWLDGKKSKSRRAYWECLALYGRLMDEGIAVHQWWG